MKKLFAILLTAVLLLVPCAIGASAEGALNSYEQEVITLLSGSITKNGATFKIPVEYVNQAKAYFLTIDMTEAQKNEIVGYINEGAELVRAQDSFPYAVKRQILELGQKACAVTGLNLVFNGATKNVVITENGTVVFENEAIVKSTGSADMTVAVAVSGIVLLVLGAAFVVAKKARLFVK